MKNTLVVLTLSFVLSLSLFGQGMYWESTVHRSFGGSDKDMTSKFYAMPKMFRSEDGDQHTAIIRLDKGVIININNDDSTYTEMTFDELESQMKKTGTKMDDAMAKLQDKLKDMPEDRRKMVEDMMKKNPAFGGGDNAKYETKKTDETQTISGYACTKYVISQGDKEVMTVWASKDVKVNEALRTDMQEFRSRMAAMIPRIGSAMFEGMKTVDGFPVQMESPNYKSTVTKVISKDTPSAQFEAPANYKKTKPAFMGDDKEEKKD